MKRLSKLLLVVVLSLGLVGTAKVNVEAEDKVSAFVTRLYTLCLNRQPDSKGKYYWEHNLKSGILSASDAVKDFLLGKEMKSRGLSDEEYVDLCYKVLLDRKSDAKGKADWITKCLDHDRSVVVKGMINSNEFTQLCNKYGIRKGSLTADTTNKGFVKDRGLTRFECSSGIEAFVERCYTKALGRKSDAKGKAYWVDQIKSGKQTAGSVASKGFFHSNEFLGFKTVTVNGKQTIVYDGVVNKYKNNKEYVKILYRTFLGREAESGGFEYWMNQLNSGKSRDQLLEGFVDSVEFGNILRGFQNETGCKVSSTPSTPKPTATPQPTPKPTPTPKPSPTPKPTATPTPTPKTTPIIIDGFKLHPDLPNQPKNAWDDGIYECFDYVKDNNYKTIRYNVYYVHIVEPNGKRTKIYQAMMVPDYISEKLLTELRNIYGDLGYQVSKTVFGIDEYNGYPNSIEFNDLY